MKTTNIIIVSILIIGVLAVSSASAAILWTSTPITKTIHIEGLQGVTISTNQFNDYATKTSPTALQNYNDVRDNSFMICLEDTNIDGDLNIQLDITGIPEGCTITAKYAYALVYTYSGTATEIIWLYDNADTKQVAYEKISGTPNYYTISYDTMQTIPINNQGITIPHSEITKTTYQTQYFTATPTQNNCNAIWIHLQFDTTQIIEYGDYQLQIVTNLGEA